MRLARENVEENLGRVAPVALRLGVLLVQDLRFREARAYLQDAARWGQFAGEIEVYVEARIELARLLRYETRWSDAADVLVDTIALATASLGPSHRLTALANLRLGIVRRYQAKGPEAESARQAALIWLESQGSEDPSLAFRVRVLEGQLRIAAQDWAGAVAVLLPLATSADAEFGKTSSEAMDGWELAGFAYDRVDRQRAIEIRRDLVSRAVERYNLTDHPGVASFYADLAYSLAGIGSYSEAEELALRAVALRARQFGRDHPRTLNSRGVLAHVWIADAWNIRETRDFASAEPYFEKALHEANAILRVRELHGGGAMNARVRVAYCLDGLDRFVEADVLYDQLLAYHVTKRARALDSARVKPIASRYVAMLQRANMDARLAAVRSTFAGL